MILRQNLALFLVSILQAKQMSKQWNKSNWNKCASSLFTSSSPAASCNYHLFWCRHRPNTEKLANTIHRQMSNSSKMAKIWTKLISLASDSLNSRLYKTNNTRSDYYYHQHWKYNNDSKSKSCNSNNKKSLSVNSCNNRETRLRNLGFCLHASGGRFAPPEEVKWEGERKMGCLRSQKDFGEIIVYSWLCLLVGHWVEGEEEEGEEKGEFWEHLEKERKSASLCLCSILQNGQLPWSDSLQDFTLPTSFFLP